jgi:hypothetical protein
MEEVSLVIDAAPLGYLGIAAHGHADCLSFTLSLLGEQILIDPGTYCYHEHPGWRTYFRGTSAHNTVRIDKLDQSLPGGPFMWLRKAKSTVEALCVDGPLQYVRACHDGYAHLPDRVVHTREVQLETELGLLRVVDTIEGRTSHQVERFWHFAEHCEVQQAGPGKLLVVSTKSTLELSCDPASRIELLHGSQSPRGGWVSRRFGNMTPTTTCAIENVIHGTTVLCTTFRWRHRH